MQQNTVSDIVASLIQYAAACLSPTRDLLHAPTSESEPILIGLQTNEVYSPGGLACALSKNLAPFHWLARSDKPSLPVGGGSGVEQIGNVHHSTLVLPIPHVGRSHRSGEALKDAALPF